MLGTFYTIDSVICAELLSSKLDFLIIDREHSTYSLNETRSVINSLHKRCERYIRVHSCNRIEIQRVLELDPQGIFIPQINSESDARKAISYAYYPPEGIRGLSPFTKPFEYDSNNSEKKKLKINEKLKVCLLIEGSNGIKSIEKILDEHSSKIYMIYFGLYDYCSSLRIDPSWENDIVKENLKKIVTICKNNNTKIGTIARTTEEVNFLKNQGIDYIVYKNDVAFFTERIDQIKRDIVILN